MYSYISAFIFMYTFLQNLDFFYDNSYIFKKELELRVFRLLVIEVYIKFSTYM